MISSELSEFFDIPASYYYGFKAFNISQCLYKIHDDSIRPRNFLNVDNENELKAILSDCENYFLYKYINSDELFHSIINFNLSWKIYDSIESKHINKEILDLLNHAFIKICLEISPK